VNRGSVKSWSVQCESMKTVKYDSPLKNSWTKKRSVTSRRKKARKTACLKNKSLMSSRTFLVQT
jgi:hypothetical protein